MLSLIVSLAVLANATSRFLAPSNPALALLINPTNVDARINLLTESLSKDIELNRLGELEQLAVEGMALEPMDARFFSLVGIMRERAGENEIAQNLYRHALTLLPTEIQALSRRFVFDVNNANYVEAVSIADKISRRWARHWNLISPYMPRLLGNDAAYNEALDRFSRQKHGKKLLVSSMIAHDTSLDLAYRLTMDWYRRGEDGLGGAVNVLSAKLVETGQNSTAYQLFRLTLNEDGKKETGYVFNGNFNLEPSGNLFDWKLGKQAGMSMGFGTRRTESGAIGETGDSFLETRFLNSPVRFSSILQILKLPASGFTLSLSSSSRGLVTPKPVKLAIECYKTGQRLAVVEFAAGNTARETTRISFDVPSAQCDLQRIRMFNGNVVESWKNLYTGSLFIHDISIKLGSE